MRKAAENVLTFLALAFVIGSLVFMMPELLTIIAVLFVYGAEIYLTVAVLDLIFTEPEVSLETVY